MSKVRYLSPYDSIQAWMAGERPALPCQARSPQELASWQRRFRARLRRLLGPTPLPAPPRLAVLEESDQGDYLRRKIVFDSERYSSVSAYLLLPKGLAPGERRPGILAAHGHGRGKVDVCAVVEDEQGYREQVAPLNYDYAVGFVRRGYVVLAPDWRGFGERQSPPDWVRAGRDQCNVNYLALGYAGYHLLRLQVWDAQRSLDLLQSLPEVDGRRLGMGGLSFGGTMTTYTAALDRRIKVACISGYLSTLGDAMGTRGLGNFCGSQYMPGLRTLGEIADVACLIAPRPLVVEMGRQDTCFVIEDMQRAYQHLAQAYHAAGRPDRLVADVHEGPHAWSGRQAYPWFAKWLGPGVSP